MKIDKLIEKIGSFTMPDGWIESQEAGLSEFLEIFPRDKLTSLTLEEYAVGNKNSFCYWLEFKDVLFGIGGGNAAKFGIYRGKDGKYYTGFGKGRQEYSDEDLDKYYSSLLDTILKALEYVDNDEIEKISALDIPMWNMVLQKILTIYYPQKFLRIGSPQVLLKCAQFLEMDDCELTKDNSILISHLIYEGLRQHNSFKDWHEEEYGTFLWSLFNPKPSQRSYYILGSKYGENAEIDIFDSILKQSVVAVGFADHIDLTEYYDLPHVEIIKHLESQGEEKRSYTAMKHFLSLKPGDWVAIKQSGSPKGNKGFLSIVAIAEVIEKNGVVYEYDPEGLIHTIHVKFLKAPIYKEFDLGGYGSTIHKISKDDRIKQIFEADYIDMEMEQGSPISKNLSLNTIIYGPPGTGKTFKLKNELFDLFTDQHSTQTNLVFYQGLAKELTWREAIAVALLDLKTATIDEIFNHPLIQANYDISDNTKPKRMIRWRLRTYSKETCPNIQCKNRREPQLFWKNENDTWTIDEKAAKEEDPDLFDALDRYLTFVPEKKQEQRYVFTTFHQSFSYEDFIEGIKPQLTIDEEESESQDVRYHIANGIFKDICQRAKNNPRKEYAIFIDEINRGNIANIFGELITLIEEDKRQGNSNSLLATLPYSKETFGVPKNLYIIGTMNTADRSVEALDTALRRRFSFLELNPDPRLLSHEKYKCEGVALEQLLLTINNRIEKLLDKDYCIGHAYFMTIKDRKNPLNELRSILANKILPLLQEYFYGDWGKIMLVLGAGFITKQDNSIEFLAVDDYSDYSEFEEKPIYRFSDSESWSLDTFKSVYES